MSSSPRDLEESYRTEDLRHRQDLRANVKTAVECHREAKAAGDAHRAAQWLRVAQRHLDEFLDDVRGFHWPEPRP